MSATEDVERSAVIFTVVSVSLAVVLAASSFPLAVVLVVASVPLAAAVLAVSAKTRQLIASNSKIQYATYQSSRPKRRSLHH